MEEDESETMEDSEQNDPTHFSELDPRSMKLVDLRRELECRSLSSRGLRSQLIARLTKAMKAEQEQEKEDEGVKKEEIASEDLKKEEASKVEDVKETEKLTKEDEDRKRKDEKEKAIQERRYMLPDNPYIIVHPSSTAKGGKFDCTVMSLSLLLDYRQEDNKEHSFEVSLFAELFNEMLMRDLGYSIYKCIATAPEKKEEDKKEKKKADAHDKDTKDAAKEPSVKKQKMDETDNKKDKKEGKDKKEEKTRSTSRSSKDTEQEESVVEGGVENKDEEEEGDNEEMEEEGSEDEVDKDMEDAEEKKPDKKTKEKHNKEKVPRKSSKRITVNPHLLMAFVYFDQNHTGYLLDKDVEDLLHTIGLQLSRAQVRKLVQKVSVRDSIHYRQYTDKVIDKPTKDSEDLNKTTHNGGSLEGNLGFLKMTQKKDTTEESGSKTAVCKSPSGKEESGMVSYKGAMLDIQSILQQLEKSEKTRAQMETRCQVATKEIGELKTKHAKSEEKRDKLESEVEKLQGDLDSKTAEINVLQSHSGKMQDIITKAKDTFKSVLEDMDSLETPATVPVKKEKK